MATLRELVTVLAEDHVVDVEVEGRRMRLVEAPLLRTLREGIGSSVGTSAPGKSSAAPGIPIDARVADLYRVISGEIVGEVIRLRLFRRGHLLLEERLLLWAEVMESDATAGELAVWIETLDGWVRAITDALVDPPTRVQIDAPCPVCGEVRALVGEDDVHALVYTYLPARPAETVVVSCRACTNVIAEGVHGARFVAQRLA